MAAAIEFEDVSKRFIVHREKPRSFQELMVSFLKRNDTSREELWALRDVSFAVERGETLGIIGPNGSGKSTLLKLITRILEPTSGRITVDGKVSALIELGAGFHPDLTGRENIFLNGSILGMSRGEMEEKFEEIVKFAELERFIDMPLKHYSSGMQMRLGFAIATSMDPDILLIDEVLAVGDEAFQRKCLRRIADFKHRGKTIVFVSHDLGSVRRLCDRVIWLDEGVIRARGRPDEVIVQYLRDIGEEAPLKPAVPAEEVGPAVEEETVQPIEEPAGAASQPPSRWGSGEVEITRVEFLDERGNPCHTFRTGERMLARIHYLAHRRIERPVFGVAIYRSDGVHINGPNTKASNYEIDHIEGEGSIDYIVDSLPLLEGEYRFSAAIYDYSCTHPYDHHERMYSFEVRRGRVKDAYGVFYIPCRWRLTDRRGE